MKSIDLKDFKRDFNQSQLRPPARISGTCLAQHFQVENHLATLQSLLRST